MWYAIGGGVALIFVLAIVFILLRRRGEKAIVSIAMLRSATREITASDVRGAFRRAFGEEPTVEKMNPDGKADLFVVFSESVPPLGVINCHGPYMSAEEAVEVAARLEDQSARAAMTDHTAWTAVDAMGIERSTREQRTVIYPMLGKLAAELYDETCLLLYLPAENRIARPGPEVEPQLRAGKIAELFGDDELHAPMHMVEADDAEIEAAIKQAQTRLPELLSAFDSRGEASKAMFKARFAAGDDGTEVIWLSLKSTTTTHLVGTIENPPIASNIPKKGQRANVPLDRVVDWVYLDEKDKPVGLFVDSILMKRGR